MTNKYIITCDFCDVPLVALMVRLVDDDGTLTGEYACMTCAEKLGITILNNPELEN